MSDVIRCVNLDWLEVHCYEPVETALNAEYYRSCGYVVHERDYGTRVYHEMFTIDGSDGLPLIEVRRNPKSQGLKGIHEFNECHLRLHNRSCYFDNAASSLASFLDQHRYQFSRISRVDVCLDFEKFDSGDDPQQFLRRYLRRRFSKINQARVHAHGDDTWTGQQWNSISWGHPKSQVITRFYNKTRQLREVKDKPYIRQAWQACHLVDDMHALTKTAPDGSVYHPEIWRVEFAISSSVRKWFTIERDGKQGDHYSVPNTLDVWDGRDRLLTMFASLAQHYFRFKHFEEGQRKDRCPDKILFNWQGQQTTYKVGRDSVAGINTRLHELETLLQRLRDFRLGRPQDIRQACDVLISALEQETLRNDLADPFSRAQLLALQQTIAMRAAGHDVTERQVLAYIRSLIKTDAPFLDDPSFEKGGTVVPPSDFQSDDL